VKNLICAFTIFMAIGSASASAVSYTLTKYDDPAFAQFCYSTVVAPYHVHFDAAVSDGEWALCGFSDRNQTAGPGSILHNSVLYHRTGSGWTFSQKGNGYFTVTELKESGVPADVAQTLSAQFKRVSLTQG
jgi:hypothetical protein